MKLFTCGVCAHPLMFENTSCVKCHHRLGYDASTNDMVALDPDGDLWRPAAGGGSASAFRFCANAAYEACNWILPADGPETFCRACALNRTIPDISVPANLALWKEIEAAKHRLVYTLLRLGLPIPTRRDDPNEGLMFDFLGDVGQQKVLTGHDKGLITLNLNEADPAARETMRAQMGEAYRTLVGHFRHEIGHFYWDRLVRDDADALAECRRIFGDETEDYDAALQRHYQNGAPADWRDHFVSAYATTHAWEDFAETWAHFLHIVDSVDTAHEYGFSVDPPAAQELKAKATVDPYAAPSMDAMLAVWGPLSFAVNALNRGMGQPDLYPFVLPPDVVAKLEFMRRLVTNAAAGETRKAA